MKKFMLTLIILFGLVSNVQAFEAKHFIRHINQEITVLLSSGERTHTLVFYVLAVRGEEVIGKTNRGIIHLEAEDIVFYYEGKDKTRKIFNTNTSVNYR